MPFNRFNAGSRSDPEVWDVNWNRTFVFEPKGEPVGLEVITAIVAVEHVGAGLGTAVFMVYLMRCCDPAHKAAHMALLTALMSVGYSLAGVASGALAEVLGYGPYFVLTFVATVPSMLLIFWAPHLRSEP